MARSAAKLKIADAEVEFVSPLREPLRSALARVEEIRAALAENEAAQAEAAAKVTALEASLAHHQRALDAAPPLERSGPRRAIADINEQLGDYRDHVALLRKNATASFDGLDSKLQDAEIEVKAARRALLLNHPRIQAICARKSEVRIESAQLDADLAFLASIGAAPESSPAPLMPPAPSPALVSWANALLTDASAKISE